MGTAAAPTTRSILPALSCAPAPGLLIDKQRQRQAYMFAWPPSSGRYADKMIHENILVAGGYDQGLSLWSRNTPGSDIAAPLAKQHGSGFLLRAADSFFRFGVSKPFRLETLVMQDDAKPGNATPSDHRTTPRSDELHTSGPLSIPSPRDA